MKRAFVGKDEVVDLLGVSLVARENLFILGPPGTAKSALVQDMARRIEGRVFDYLLTRFTEPNEIFGPFDIRQLRDGNLVTNTEGMLPEATFVFLDELLNANSAILNSLLMVLNERVFRRGRETKNLPTLMVVGASNSLPEDEALRALFDRFLLRVNCSNVPDDSLAEVLQAGWQLERRETLAPTLTVADVIQVQKLVETIEFADITDRYVETVRRLRTAGIDISDRRAVKLQRMLAASAILCGRDRVHASDMWVLRYIWDSLEQQEILNSLVGKAIETEDDEDVVRHPLAQVTQLPTAEKLAQDLEHLQDRLTAESADEVEISRCKDQLAILSGQLQWITSMQQREHLQTQIDQLWGRFETVVEQ
jgi:MoxR-like ATPase